METRPIRTISKSGDAIPVQTNAGGRLCGHLWIPELYCCKFDVKYWLLERNMWTLYVFSCSSESNPGSYIKNLTRPPNCLQDSDKPSKNSTLIGVQIRGDKMRSCSSSIMPAPQVVHLDLSNQRLFMCGSSSATGPNASIHLISFLAIRMPHCQSSLRNHT